MVIRLHLPLSHISQSHSAHMIYHPKSHCPRIDSLWVQWSQSMHHFRQKFWNSLHSYRGSSNFILQSLKYVLILLVLRLPRKLPWKLVNSHVKSPASVNRSQIFPLAATGSSSSPNLSLSAQLSWITLKVLPTMTWDGPPNTVTAFRPVTEYNYFILCIETQLHMCISMLFFFFFFYHVSSYSIRCDSTWL